MQISGITGMDCDDECVGQINKVQEMREIMELNQIVGNRYHVVREIGRGGMGIVYFAHDTKLNRPVAIKMIGVKCSAFSQGLERFCFEARVTAKLQHPHIVQIYEAIDTNPVPLYVMEYVEGTRLDKYAKQREVRETASIMVPILKAVGYAHTKGVLHRDIKPSNILITDSGEPKIMDFGLAKLLGEEESAKLEDTSQGAIMGSPSYMSPEQARGDMEKVDTRSDIYSLGATLYTILTGTPPFKGRNFIDVIDQVLNKEPVPPSTLRPGLSTDLDGICLKAIDKNPDKRYQTAYEMLEDVRNYLNGRPVKARHYTFKEKTIRSIRLKKELFILATALVWLMFTGIALTLKTHHNISRSVVSEELRNKVKGLAATVAFVIDGDVVESIKSQSDLARPEVKKIIALLKGVKNRNDEVEYVWIMRPSQKKPGYAEFVIEHDYFDAPDELDVNNNFVLEPEEELSKVGDIFEETPKFPELLKGFEQPAADRDLSVTDRWDINLSGYAPVVNYTGKSVGIVGIDIRSSEVGKSFHKIKQSILLSLVFLFLFAILLNVLIFLWLIGRWEAKAN